MALLQWKSFKACIIWIGAANKVEWITYVCILYQNNCDRTSVVYSLQCPITMAVYQSLFVIVYGQTLYIIYLNR